MNISIFLGTRGVGKSHIMIYAAKLLANAGKKVLVIDTTNDQGLYNFFNYNQALESCLEEPFIREGIDIIVRDPSRCMDAELTKIPSSICGGNYDILLIESEGFMDEEIFSQAKNVFLVQNFDKDKLIRNNYLVELLNGYRNLQIVFNQAVECKLKKEYVCRFLGLGTRQWFEIPLNESDLILSYNNKLGGRLDLKKYSYDFKQAIFEIADEITDIGLNKKLFKVLTNK